MMTNLNAFLDLVEYFRLHPQVHVAVSGHVCGDMGNVTLLIVTVEECAHHVRTMG